ncbi:MAG: low molecular weight protein-tyrosine-phosphatase [Nocardioides sp.]
MSVASCGLGGWHVGDGMDHRSARHLAAAGYDPSRHVAKQIQPSWLDGYDVLLAMDDGHLRDLHAMAGTYAGASDRIRLFGDFDPVHPGVEVPDPYYGGDHGFQEVLSMVERTCDQLLSAVTDVLGGA